MTLHHTTGAWTSAAGPLSASGLPWLLFGVAGAAVSLALPYIQTRTYRRARRLGFDEAAYGRTQDAPDTLFHTPITPLKVYAEPLAARGVGVPLGVAGAVVFLVFGLFPSSWMWAVAGMVSIALSPLRRVLGLRVLHRIASEVEFANGPVRDRDGTAVRDQSVRDFVRTWYRHEYRFEPRADKDSDALSMTVLAKFWWVAGQLLVWPVILPAAQLMHTAMAQNPAWALGHTGEDAPGAMWAQTLGEARPPARGGAGPGTGGTRPPGTGGTRPPGTGTGTGPGTGAGAGPVAANGA